MTTLRRHARQFGALAEAMEQIAAAAACVVRALPPRPSGRDEAALAGVAGQLPGLMLAMQRAAARLRRDAPSAEIRDLLETARVTGREIPRVVAALGLVLERRAEPLIAPRVPTNAATRRAEVLSHGYNLLEVAASGQDQAEAMRDHAYPFIPLGAESFVERLQAAWRLLAVRGGAAQARFLEVGAGAGSKLFLAAQFFPVVEGIELDETYLARAEWLTNTARPQRRVTAADALSFDRYGEFDVIYSYLPILDEARQTALERRIFAQAREGALIVAPMMRGEFLPQQDRLVGEIVVKGVTGDALSALAAEAQLVGTVAPPLPLKDRGGRRNLVLPAIEALAWAGFAA